MEEQHDRDSASQQIEKFFEDAIDVIGRYFLTVLALLIHPFETTRKVLADQFEQYSEPAFFLAVTSVLINNIAQLDLKVSFWEALSYLKVESALDLLFQTVLIVVISSLFSFVIVRAIDASNSQNAKVKRLVFYVVAFSSLLPSVIKPVLVFSLGWLLDRLSETIGVPVALEIFLIRLDPYRSLLQVLPTTVWFVYSGLVLWTAVRRLRQFDNGRVPKKTAGLVLCLCLPCPFICYYIGTAPGRAFDRRPLKLQIQSTVVVTPKSLFRKDYDTWSFVVGVTNVSRHPVQLTRKACGDEILDWSAHSDPILLLKPSEVGWIKMAIHQPAGLLMRTRKRSVEVRCGIDGEGFSTELDFQNWAGA